MKLPGIPGVMDAGNFAFVPSMNGDRCKMTVTHKFTKRVWEREFDEDEWDAVRVELLGAIEKDLSTPKPEAPSP